MLENNQKQCTKCQEIKEISEFATDRNQCKCCRKAYMSEFRAKNVEAIKAYNAIKSSEYRAKNADSLRIYKANYYTKNINRLGAKNREYRAVNADKIKKYMLEYGSNNLEKQKLWYNSEYKIKSKDKIKDYFKSPMGRAIKANIDHKRRTAKKQGNVTTSRMIEVRARPNCFWGNIKFTSEHKIHVDHFYTLSKGGLHTFSNQVISCAKCNI